MTQCDRVLAALTRVGDHGVTQVDFIRFPTIDGGPPILRIAARVKDLRDAGFEIITKGERDGCAIYKLAPKPETLFETPVRNEMWEAA